MAAGWAAGVLAASQPGQPLGIAKAAQQEESSGDGWAPDVSAGSDDSQAGPGAGAKDLDDFLWSQIFALAPPSAGTQKVKRDFPGNSAEKEGPFERLARLEQLLGEKVRGILGPMPGAFGPHTLSRRPAVREGDVDLAGPKAARRPPCPGPWPASPRARVAMEAPHGLG